MNDELKLGDLVKLQKVKKRWPLFEKHSPVIHDSIWKIVHIKTEEWIDHPPIRYYRIARMYRYNPETRSLESVNVPEFAAHYNDISPQYLRKLTEKERLTVAALDL